MCTIFSGFLFINSTSVSNKMTQGSALYRGDDFETILYKCYIGQDSLIKEFDKGYVIQAIGKFAVEENREYVSFKFFLNNFFKKRNIKHCHYL
jgi:hypothetical protein